MGSGCEADAHAAACETRGPQFISHHQQIWRQKLTIEKKAENALIRTNQNGLKASTVTIAQRLGMIPHD